jgi:hypothetical protein
MVAISGREKVSGSEPTEKENGIGRKSLSVIRP